MRDEMVVEVRPVRAVMHRVNNSCEMTEVECKTSGTENKVPVLEIKVPVVLIPKPKPIMTTKLKQVKPPKPTLKAHAISPIEIKPDLKHIPSDIIFAPLMP